MAADQSSLTANVSSSPPAMASDLVDMINRLTLAKTKLEKKLDINRECIIEAIEGKDRTVKIKKWLQSCKECSEKSVSKNEGILFLTSRESVKAALEHWLELLANKNDLIYHSQNLMASETKSLCGVFSMPLKNSKAIVLKMTWSSKLGQF